MSQPLLGPITRSVYHAWIPKSNDTHNQFVDKLLKYVRAHPTLGHQKSVSDFSHALSGEQKKLFEDALVQVQKYYSKWADPNLVVDRFEDFLNLLDGIVRSAPRLYKANINGVVIGEPVGVPLYLILDLISNTSAAYTLFTQKSFNIALKDLLNDWGAWLKTDNSSYTLANEWFSVEGLAILESGLGGKSFDQTFKIEVSPPQRYKSWDSFFTRTFLDTNPPLRPILHSPNPDISFLYNACESTVFRTAEDVQCHDTFWLKTQNYSLYDILGGDLDKPFAGEYAPKLRGGSVFQAFLSPADYHRWHNPIEGKVTHRIFPGTYYAVLPDDGAPVSDPDLLPGDPHGAIIRSQPWLSVAATRAVFIIENTPAESPVELAAVVQIGMVEVSSCDVTYDKGHRPGEPVPLKVGQELGMFHFGGSSYTLIVKLKPGYQLVFQDIVNRPIRPGQHRWVNSVIGQFWKKENQLLPKPNEC